MGSGNTTSNANEIKFRASHESDDEFSALDLLPSNIFLSQDKLPQDVGVSEKEAPFTTCNAPPHLENNPWSALVLNVPLLNQPMHPFEQFAWDSRKNELCAATLLEKIKRSESTEDANEAGKSNPVFSSQFQREHSTEYRCQGNINEGNQLTQRQEAPGNNSPSLPFQLWNSSERNNVSNESYASNSVAQQTGESYNLSTYGECSKTAFTTSEHLLKQSQVCTKENLQRNFAHVSPLAAHMQRDDEPYKCDQCSKAFRIKSKLKSHYVTHKKEKPFKCGYCDFVTKWNGNLKDHIKRKHGLCVQQDSRLTEQQSMTSNDE